MVHIEVLETPDLGNRSYLVHDGSIALAIDPQRDIDRVERLLERHGLELGAVAETHVHNDYVTGGHALARKHGADYLVHADERPAYSFRPVREGTVLDLGGLSLRVIETPGHTASHVSYVVTDPARTGDASLFSGGCLLYGGVGRTDLFGAERAEALARRQVASARRLTAEVDPTTLLYPTHGFGSFCSAGGGACASMGRLADEITGNAALTVAEDEYVAGLLAADLPIPAHYAHMAPLNLAGPSATPRSTRGLLPVGALVDRVRAGAWVVDIRHRAVALPTRLRGSIHVELGGQFATYVGWVVPWGEPITLVGDGLPRLREAVRQLSRIGIDDVELALYDEAVSDMLPPDLLDPLPGRTFEDARDAQGSRLVDVRTEAERSDSHVPGSLHIPFHRLQESPLPHGELWIHCQSGFRALVAASLLARQGRPVGVIEDDLGRARELGLLAS